MTKLLSVNENNHFLSWQQIYNDHPSQRMAKPDVSRLWKDIQSGFASSLAINSLFDQVHQDAHFEHVYPLCTPLSFAVEFGLADVVRHLLDNGADIEVLNPVNHPLLQVAVEHGFTRIVEMLLLHGANAGLLGEFRDSLSQMAVEGMLLKKGADVNAENSSGSIKLRTEILLQPSDSLDPRPDDRWTALHIAGYYGFAEVVQTLLLHGADSKAKVKCGMTAAFYAARHQRLTVEAILQGHGVSMRSVFT